MGRPANVRNFVFVGNILVCHYIPREGSLSKPCRTNTSNPHSLPHGHHPGSTRSVLLHIYKPEEMLRVSRYICTRAGYPDVGRFSASTKRFSGSLHLHQVCESYLFSRVFNNSILDWVKCRATGRCLMYQQETPSKCNNSIG